MVIMAWKQVFIEAGGSVPDRNVERLLRDTHVPVHLPDDRRLDLVVPGLNVERGLPLFCDVTIISPLTRQSQARAGASNRGGALLEQAQRDNDENYGSVLETGLGALYCLGFEVFGRWSKQASDLIPLLARERARGMHPRLRRGTALSYLYRWSGIIAVAVQKATSIAATREVGAVTACGLPHRTGAVALIGCPRTVAQGTSMHGGRLPTQGKEVPSRY